MEWRTQLMRVSVLMMALGVTSCSGDGRVPVYPVQGKVMYRNKPVPRAMVVFHPAEPLEGEKLLPHGETGEDGSFQLSTYAASDGAPAGSYAVTITWPEMKKDEAGDPVFGGDRLKGRFNDAASSRWKPRIVEGDNTLQPFQIE